MIIKKKEGMEKGVATCHAYDFLTEKGEDLSTMLTGVKVDFPIDGAVEARVSMYIERFEVDGADIKINSITAPKELLDAMRAFFVKGVRG